MTVTCTASIPRPLPQAPPKHMMTRNPPIYSNATTQPTTSYANITKNSGKISQSIPVPSNAAGEERFTENNVGGECNYLDESNPDDSSETVNEGGRNLSKEFEKLYVEEGKRMNVNDHDSDSPRQAQQARDGKVGSEIQVYESFVKSGVEREQPEQAKDDKSMTSENNSLISPGCVIEEATCVKSSEEKDLFNSDKDDCDDLTDSMSKEDITLSTATITISATEESARSRRLSHQTPTKINTMAMPDFYLHPDLRRSLSQSQINRISFYSVVHDVNKEAAAMASNDQSAFTPRESDSVLTVPSTLQHSDLDDDTFDESKKNENTYTNSAIVDEEYWLLSAIASRTSEEVRTTGTHKTCSLSDALGENDNETNDPLAQAECRTQLWKPSRSWWEARSGKNPWIEPRSHNKRWRYLWPLIHYHKFIARCIKKLKRNGVDVKSSQSPVSVFLREEVCAVSDHLANVSKFTAEEWLRALAHFHGWTDTSPVAEACLREMISLQKLRSLNEPSDVQSPLLKDQIDEQFLKAMAAARLQMQEGKDDDMHNDTYEYHDHAPMYNQNMYDYAPHNAPPMHGSLPQRMWPKIPKAPNQQRRNNNKGRRGGNNNRYNYYQNNSRYPVHGNHMPMHGHYHQHNHQYPNMYHHSMPPGVYGNSPYGPPAHPPSGSHYHPPPHYWQPPTDGPYYHYPHGYNGSHPPPNSSMPPYSDYMHHNPSMYGHNQRHNYVEPPQYSDSPNNATENSLHNSHETTESPSGQVPPSPYWGHLIDQDCLATPQHGSSPYHHHHGMQGRSRRGKHGNRPPYEHAKPLLFNPSTHYYQRPPGGGITPPSPATQFLMPGSGWGSPQMPPKTPEENSAEIEEVKRMKDEMETPQKDAER